MNDNYESKKRILKIVGICLIVLGVVFIIVGAVGLDRDPASGMFAFMPVGIMTLGIGVMLIMLAYRREIAAHQAKIYAPVLKDLKQEVMPDNHVLICPDCGTGNEIDSKFCKECGKPLRKTCPYCNAEVGCDSKFCNKCGRSL